MPERMVEISNIEIKQTDFPECNEFNDLYYICGDCDDCDSIPINYDNLEDKDVYLHKNGTWKRGTQDKEIHEYSGFFTTLEEAQQVLGNYYNNNPKNED
jgi:hypothetical protein